MLDAAAPVAPPPSPNWCNVRATRSAADCSVASWPKLELTFCNAAPRSEPALATSTHCSMDHDAGEAGSFKSRSLSAADHEATSRASWASCESGGLAPATATAATRNASTPPASCWFSCGPSRPTPLATAACTRRTTSPVDAVMFCTVSSRSTTMDGRRESTPATAATSFASRHRRWIRPMPGSAATRRASSAARGSRMSMASRRAGEPSWVGRCT